MKSIKLFAVATSALVAFASCDIHTFEPAPDVDPFDGVIETAQHVDLGLSIEWAGYNVGATDPSDAGSYFACGEDTTRIYYSINDLMVDSVVICKGYNQNTSKYDAARNNWGEHYKFPSQKQVEELQNSCEFKLCSYKKVRGYAVTGPNGKSIFFPCAGYKALEKTLNNDANPTYQATYWYSYSGSQFYFKYNEMNYGTTTNLYLGRPVRAVYVED